jgi:hypothetical protein
VLEALTTFWKGFMKMSLRALVGLGLFALAGMYSSAGANSITVDFGTPTVTSIGGGQFRWDYGISVSANASVQSGDGFTIYDFAGYTSDAQAVIPANWTLNSSNTNAPDYFVTTPSFFTETRALTDNPLVTDLILTYSGPTTGATGSPTSLGIFSFVTIYNTKVTGFLEGTDHSISPNQPQTNNFNTFVPTAVPTPAAIWGGLSLLGALFTAKVTRRK